MNKLVECSHDASVAAYVEARREQETETGD